MKRASLVIWVAAGILVVAAVTLGILLLAPVTTKLDTYATRANEATAALGRLESTAVGEAFELNLGAFALGRGRKAGQIHDGRARLASKLDAPFRDVKIDAGASRPSYDEFRRAYNFNGDQLRIRIRDQVSRAGGPEVKDLALLAPPFSGEPMDAAAMTRWQRLANVEARILEGAAKAGGAPAARLRIDDEPAPADDPDDSYLRLRIGFDIHCFEGRTSAIVHGLLACADDAGGVVRLAGLSETPAPEARLKETAGAAQKKLALTLILGFPAPVEDL